MEAAVLKMKTFASKKLGLSDRLLGLVGDTAIAEVSAAAGPVAAAAMAGGKHDGTTMYIHQYDT